MVPPTVVELGDRSSYTCTGPAYGPASFINSVTLDKTSDITARFGDTPMARPVFGTLVRLILSLSLFTFVFVFLSGAGSPARYPPPRAPGQLSLPNATLVLHVPMLMLHAAVLAHTPT